MLSCLLLPVLLAALTCAQEQEEKEAAPGEFPAITPVTAEELLQEIELARGDVVLLNFWATWCLPCVAELPDLLKVRNELGDRGLRLILVSCDFPEQQEAARKLLAKQGVDFQTWLKNGKDDPFISAVDDEWEGTLPATFVYDRSGRKRHFHQGKATYEDLRGLVLDVMDGSRHESGN